MLNRLGTSGSRHTDDPGLIVNHATLCSILILKNEGASVQIGWEQPFHHLSS